jgi:hypothetical protein
MTDPATNYAIGGIFALFIVQGASLLRDFINSRKTDPAIAAMRSLVEGQAALTKAMTKAVDAQVGMKSEIKDLHRWHQPDDSGRQPWRNPDVVETLQNLDRSIVSLNRAVERIMVVG